ncbi:50S ribosomal protein L6 [Candidatus Methylocalor cossyra]|uniref:50S ribosomal protein L6 n=1 Tax=Candidatus Methylocalor cossyra TaxID=3108543 RepID=UPI0032B2C717
MSRVAKNPVKIPEGVEVSLQNREIQIEGRKGVVRGFIDPLVTVNIDNNEINVKYDVRNRAQKAIAGTTRACLANMVEGVTKGYERKLVLVGVGYRAQATGKILTLNIGFSHAIDYSIPEGITIETPSQTEIIVRGCDKRQVGQIAADIRSYRAPEPYKGKGIRYADEVVEKKEAKKK